MSDTPDAELLEQFAWNQSEVAFAELVERHLGLVYSAAFRKTENPQHAEDIAQAVFIILARKAGSLGPKTVLPGWLYHTTRLTAANFQRTERRRVRREQEAFMQSITNESAPDDLWRELSPLLEDAMACLGSGDRDAIVLRYFQNRSMAEVGAAAGTSEDAAKMRVNRAVEKLRKFFKKRGVVSTAAVIVGVISSHSVQAAPAALGKSITAGTLAKGAAASASTLALAKQALKLMAWSKAKTTIVGVAIAMLGIGTTTAVVNAILSAPERDLIKLEDHWGEAVVRADFAFVDSVIANGYISTGGDGIVRDKAQLIALLKGSHKISFSINDDYRVKVYGNTAVVTYRDTIKGEDKGTDISGQYRETDIWVKNGGRWQCVAGQESKISN